MVDKAVQTISKLQEQSRFRRKNNLSQRRLLHETLLKTHCQEKGLQSNNYAFVIIEPAPKLRKTLQSNSQGHLQKVPPYKILMLAKKNPLIKVIYDAIKTHYKIRETESLFILSLTNRSMVSSGETINDLYDKMRDPEDDFVYLFFNTTETF